MSPVDDVVKIAPARLQQLKEMMEAEQSSDFPTDQTIPSQATIPEKASEAKRPAVVPAAKAVRSKPGAAAEPAPWDLKQVKDSVSKKMVVKWLQEHAADSLLEKFKLRGPVDSVAKKKKKSQMIDAYAAYLETQK